MCEHGDTVDCEVIIDARLSHSGQAELKVKPIDRCISGLVMALEAGGVTMLGSCCGHGRAPGTIVLADGRQLVIFPAQTTDMARALLEDFEAPPQVGLHHG